jgi:hypothetical protein
MEEIRNDTTFWLENPKGNDQVGQLSVDRKKTISLKDIVYDNVD